MSKKQINDGFKHDFSTSTEFDSILEIPKLLNQNEIQIPTKLIPFTKRKQSINKNEYIHFYEQDNTFLKLLHSSDKYINELKKFQGIIGPDFSLYRDMPLALQILNTYNNRAVSKYFQDNNIKVIPNVRWGDERSYTSKLFNEPFAFLGIPKNYIVSIGTYGCIKSRINKYYFRNGLKNMIDYLKPEIVIVYGGMSNTIFNEFKNQTRFINFSDWTTIKKGGKNGLRN